MPGARAQEPLGVVFLGCGRATQMHSRTLSRTQRNLRLHYASRTEERARAFRDRYSGAGAYGSYEEALDDPTIDVAVVATPPSSHLDLAKRALEHGKDVIVEKPAFLQPEDFRAIGRVSANAGKRVFVAENYYYKPVRRRLKRILSEGLIGEPLILQVNALKQQDAAGWRTDPALAGGGPLFEGGIHWVSLMASLGLEVAGATGYQAGGAGSAPKGSAGIEPTESMMIVIEYSGGAVGTLGYSWEVPSHLKGLRLSKIFGRSGSVTFESNGVFVLLMGKRMRLYGPSLFDLSGYRAMFTDFFHAIRTGAEPGMTLEMAERDVRLVRDIYKTVGAPSGVTP